MSKEFSKNGKLKIEPLRNLPVIKDLAADMDPFFDKWIKAEGVFHPSKSRNDGIEPVRPDMEQRKEVDAGIECINCAVCHAACDVVTSNLNYLGPAALNRAWTLINDVKDSQKNSVLDAVSLDGGCHNCHSMGNCTNFCPNDLNPMLSIARLKRETTRSFFRSKS